MKKLFSIALVALTAGALLCSCQKKSTEEQFIDDMNELYEILAETMNDSYVAAEKQKAVMEDYGQDAYGKVVDSESEWTEEDFNCAGVELSKEQIKELNALRKKHSDAEKRVDDRIMRAQSKTVHIEESPETIEPDSEEVY